MVIIYGVNTDEEVTPLKIRDAIIECFYQAHCSDAQLGLDDEEMNRDYCRAIVEKAFDQTGNDFEKPTKESILQVMGELAEFAKKFRDAEIIKKHAAEIMKLIERL